MRKRRALDSLVQRARASREEVRQVVEGCESGNMGSLWGVCVCVTEVRDGF